MLFRQLYRLLKCTFMNIADLIDACVSIAAYRSRLMLYLRLLLELCLEKDEDPR